MTRLKKPIFSIFGMALLATGFVACSSDDSNTVNESVESVKSTLSENGISTMKIDNGIYSENNNIMVFESEELFAETVDYLFESNEQYNDWLDKTIPLDLDEDEEESYMLANNLNEDQVYIDFENRHQFSSLRKDINIKEEAWLLTQGEAEFNANTDPDSPNSFRSRKSSS